MKKHTISLLFLVEKHLQFNEYFLMHIQEQILTLLYSGCFATQKFWKVLCCFHVIRERRLV